MPTLFAALFLAASTAADAATFDRLVDDLCGIRKSARTVVIEFTVEQRDEVFHKKSKATGRFVMLRDAGTIFAMLEDRNTDDPTNSTRYVLRGDDLTMWNDRTKTLLDFPSAKTKGGYRFAVDNLSGLLWLLDREEAGKRLRMSPLRPQDEHYAYLRVAVDEYPMLSLSGRPTPFPAEYRVVVGKAAHGELPRGSIRQVGQATPGTSVVHTITKWAVDAPEHAKITPADFPDPAKLPDGWKAIHRP